MPAYRTIVVGTDGSSTSLAGAEDALKSEAYLVVGGTPAEETLRVAEDRAAGSGAAKIRTAAVDGSPADVLQAAVTENGADLLVVGNKGLNTLSGRLLGSVPSDVARRSSVDVLIVHTI
jgi:nucleotide-binding universal stress UspA family protein